MKRAPAAPQDPNCVQYYAPGHLARDSGGDISYKLAATYIAFNSAGSEMLVNMGGEQIYLFDVDNPRSIHDLRVPQNYIGNHSSSPCNCFSMVRIQVAFLADYYYYYIIRVFFVG